MTNTQSVMQLYTAYFNRVADKGGVDYWVGEMESKGWSLGDVANSFSDQTEYTDLYDGLSNTQVVEKVYQNVLNRDGEADGIEYWSGELEKGSISVSQLVQAVVNSATEKDDNGNYVNETDGVLFTNKISVSQYAYDINLNLTGQDSVSLSSISSDSVSISDKKSEITEILFIGKTFYGVMDWNSYVLIENTFNENGILLFKNTPDGDFTETYQIANDGRIYETNSEGKFYWNILWTNSDYIQVDAIEDINGQLVQTNINDGYFFFNKDTAQSYYDSIA